MNSLVVGGLLKHIYPDFGMKKFSNRLKLQKIIYLLQQSGINLGYDFSWYLYGPYSTQLTRTGYNLPEFNKIKSVGFEDAKDNELFNDFVQKIKPHKNSEFWLEVASSIHTLKKLYPKKNKIEIIKEIQKKSVEFADKKEEISKVWIDIEGWLI